MSLFGNLVQIDETTRSGVLSGYFSNFILSNGSTVKWVSLNKVTRDLRNKSVNIFDDYSSDSNF